MSRRFSFVERAREGGGDVGGANGVLFYLALFGRTGWLVSRLWLPRLILTYFPEHRQAVVFGTYLVHTIIEERQHKPPMSTQLTRKKSAARPDYKYRQNPRYPT